MKDFKKLTIIELLVFCFILEIYLENKKNPRNVANKPFIVNNVFALLDTTDYALFRSVQ